MNWKYIIRKSIGWSIVATIVGLFFISSPEIFYLTFFAFVMALIVVFAMYMIIE